LITNPAAVPAAVATVAPAATAPAAVAPATTAKPEVNAQEKSGEGWNIDLNHNEMSIYARGDAASATLQWKGAAPAVPAFALYDYLGVKLRDLPARAVDGHWEITLPTDKLGYFELRPEGKDADSIIPALGSRPAGRLTFAVVDAPNPNPSHNFTLNFARISGTTWLEKRDGQNYDYTLLPYLGVQAVSVNYRWGQLEADGPGTLEKSLAKDIYPKWTRELKMVPYFYLNTVPMWAADTSRLPEKERSGKSTQHVPPRDWAQYEAFLNRLIPYIVKKYDFLPQRTYEVMWEPVIPWGWYGTSEEIVKTFEIAHRVIHKYDPHGFVAGPTLTGLDGLTISNYESLLKLGLGKYIDVIAWHPYTGYPPEKSAIPEALHNVHAITKQYVGHDLPFIGTEYGFPQARTGSALNQAYGLTASILIFKYEGVRQQTLFYLHDYKGEPGYGMTYNLVPNQPFGPSKISPKPAFPMIRAAFDQVGNATPVGKLDYLGADIWGYVFKNNADGTLFAALWDASDRNRAIQFDTGVSQVTLVDAFGNSQKKTTKDGILTLQLTRAPLYVHGISAKLYGEGRIAPLLQAPDVWKVYRDQNATLPVSFGRDLGGANATLIFDTDSAVSADQQRQPVSVRQGAKTTLQLHVAPDAPLGVAAGSIRIREGENTLYRAVQRIEVLPELEFGALQTHREGQEWRASTTVKNAAPFAWSGKASLVVDGVAQVQNLELPAGASREISFPVTLRDDALNQPAKVLFQSKDGGALERAEKLLFWEIPKRSAAPDFWTKLTGVPLHATAATETFRDKVDQIKGEADLSAQFSAAYDDQNLYIQVVARDDVHRQNAEPGLAWTQDSLQLGVDMSPGRDENTNTVTENYERTSSEWMFSFGARGAEIYLSIAPGGSTVPEHSVVTFPGAKLEGGVQGDQTIYRVTLPWKLLDPRGVRNHQQIGIAAALNDSDRDTEPSDRLAIGLFGGIVNNKSPENYGIARLLP
jgi:hypothetical protein